MTLICLLTFVFWIHSSVGDYTSAKWRPPCLDEITGSYMPRCPDGTCIPPRAVCDCRMDCPEGFDEFQCIKSQDDMVKCKFSPVWIYQEWRCDGTPDCPDFSDEDCEEDGNYLTENDNPLGFFKTSTQNIVSSMRRDNYTLIGEKVALVLRRLHLSTSLYTEKLISDILFHSAVDNSTTFKHMYDVLSKILSK